MPRNEDHFGGTMDRGSSKWLHANQIILHEGVTFNVRYVGCIAIKTSMKQLDFKQRSLISRECINRVVEAAGLKSPSKRNVDKSVSNCIEERPILDNSGLNAILTITSKYMCLANLENGNVILKYDIPNISFASCGDSDTLNFVAFTAKDAQDWRACYVLESDSGQAQDLIASMGRAFQLRYNSSFIKTQDCMDNLNTDKDYYNDLPDKLPPDLLEEPLSEPTPKIDIAKTQENRFSSSNLIDLNSPPPSASGTNPLMLLAENNNQISEPQLICDVFDIQPFTLAADVQRSQLQTETWFHGVITRIAAEQLLVNDGDFLVRESETKPGQYVLTGLQDAKPRHLLLMDPNGVVRTKDRIFDGITHLVNYHSVNLMPIVSCESALLLRKPVPKLI